MNSALFTRSYPAPPLDTNEILRYAGCTAPEERVLSLMESCLAEVLDCLAYRVCFRELPLSVIRGVCYLGTLSLPSQSLAVRLKACKSAVIFAATVGVAPDRMISRYGRIAPSRGLMHQAIGAERIEALCEVFFRDLEREKGRRLLPRFSPGYGDLSLVYQRDLISLLDAGRAVGISLNESCLMSPSKSVTAIVGI